MTHNDKQLFFEAKQSNLAYVDGINNKCTPILSFVLKKNPADPKLLYSILYTPVSSSPSSQMMMGLPSLAVTCTDQLSRWKVTERSTRGPNYIL